MSCWCTWIHSIFTGWIGMWVPQWIALGESMCLCHIEQCNANHIYISLTLLPEAVTRSCLLAFNHCCSLWWNTPMHVFKIKGSSQGDKVCEQGHQASASVSNPCLLRIELLWWKVDSTQVCRYQMSNLLLTNRISIFEPYFPNGFLKNPHLETKTSRF